MQKRREASRPETDFKQNSLALGSGNNLEQTVAPLDKNPEVAQAGAKHNEGTQRLNEQIESLSSRIWNREQLVRRCLKGGAVILALTLLFGLASDSYLKREPNMVLRSLLQKQGVEQLYSGDGENRKLDSFYDFLHATTTPNENGQDDEIHFLYPTTKPEN